MKETRTRLSAVESVIARVDSVILIVANVTGWVMVIVISVTEYRTTQRAISNTHARVLFPYTFSYE